MLGTRTYCCKGETERKMDKYINVYPNKSNLEPDRVYHYTKGEHFKFLNGNREINKPHARKIERAIENGAAPFIDAISVDINTYIVVDGQHRLTAFREAWSKGIEAELDVRFKEYPENILPIIIDMNTNHKNWTTNDRVKSITQEGNVMDKLVKFCTEDAHPLLHRINKKGIKTPTLRYSTALILGRSITQDIKENKVSISDEEFAFGHQLQKEAEAILDSLNLKTRTGGWMEHFLTAWHNIRKDRMYSDALEKLSFTTFVEQLPFYVDRTTDGTTKEWEERLRNAISQIFDDCG